MILTIDFSPGFVNTNFADAMGLQQSSRDPLYTKAAQMLPAGKVAVGDDIAHAILFLASDESSYITGINLISDGGQCAANVPIVD